MDHSTGRARFRLVVPAYPAFNIYSNIARRTTALGPVCVATTVSRLRGWDVEVIDENNYRKFGPKDRAGHPDHATLQTIRHADVVGLYGGLSSTIPRVYDLARFYQTRGVTTIAGGQHFTGENIADALANGIDYIVLDEGDDSVPALLTALRNGDDPARVAGIAFRRDGHLVMTAPRPPIADFERLPLPDFNLVRYARISLYPVGWIRGCGMNCEFCAVKGKPRPCSVERVVRQIAVLLEKHGARHFFIVDDLFGHQRSETLRFCRLLAEYQQAVATRLDITVQIRLDRARDADLLQAMRAAGINTVCVGFESPIADELLAMNKRVKPQEMQALTRLFHQAGFLVHGMFIFGYPLPAGVQLRVPIAERIRQFRRFITKTKLDTIQVLLPVPLPGTELTKRLAAQGRIFPREIIGWEYYDGNFPLFQPDAPMTAEEMHAAVRKIMGRFYRFKSMFGIARNVLLFPAMLAPLWNLKLAWLRWYRAWRNEIMRFAGWIVLKRWTADFKKGTFTQKLVRAQRQAARHEVAGANSPPAGT